MTIFVLLLVILLTIPTHPQNVIVSLCNIKESSIRRQVLGGERGDLRDALLPRPSSIRLTEEDVKGKIIPFNVHKTLRIESNIDIKDEVRFF